MRCGLLRISIIFLLILFFNTTAFAEEADPGLPADNMLDSMVMAYKTEAFTWIEPIRDAAFNIFYSLLLIEFVWTAILLVLASAELEKYVVEIIKRVLFAGFFLTLLHYGPEWGNAIVNSFVHISKRATGGMYVSASDIFDTGVAIVMDIMKSAKWFSLTGEPIILFFISLVIIVCFSLASAVMVLTTIEMHVVLNAAVILLGFGASRWTRDYAKAYLLYALAVGLKLFSLILIVDIGFRVIDSWRLIFDGDKIEQAMMLAGGSIVFFVLILAVPNILASFVRSTNISTSDNLMKVASLTSSVATTGALVGQAAYKAGKSGVGSYMVGSAAWSGSKARGNEGVWNVAKGAANLMYEDFKSMAGRSPSTIGGRMAQRIKKATDEYEARKPRKYYE